MQSRSRWRAVAGDRPHAGEPFVTGVEHPQHLLAVGDRLLVVDHDSGTILAVSR